MIDEIGVRAETPGCQDRVFLDSAGASLPPQRVVRAMVRHLRREAEVGGYRAAEECSAERQDLKVSLGRLLGCEPRCIALTDSATRAWTTFFSAVPLQPGDRILMARSEYANNAINLLHRAGLTSARVEIVPSTPDGRIDLHRLAEVMDDRVRLISVVHVPNNTGVVNPVRDVVEIAHQHGALVLLDACQSVGQLDIDVGRLQVDGLTGTGRKWLRGPRGTGFLFVRSGLESVLQPAVLDVRGARWSEPLGYQIADDATRFELSEANVAAQLGLKAAVDYLLELGQADVQAAVLSKADYLRRGLGAIAGIHLHGDGRGESGILSFTLDGVDATEVRQTLWTRGVTVATIDRSMALLDMSARGLERVVRASPHYFVTTDELDRTVEAIARIAAEQSRTH